MDDIKKRLVVTVPEEVYIKLKMLAYKKDLTLSYIATKIFEGYLKSMKEREHK